MDDFNKRQEQKTKLMNYLLLTVLWRNRQNLTQITKKGKIFFPNLAN